MFKWHPSSELNASLKNSKQHMRTFIVNDSRFNSNETQLRDLMECNAGLPTFQMSKRIYSVDFELQQTLYSWLAKIESHLCLLLTCATSKTSIGYANWNWVYRSGKLQTKGPQLRFEHHVYFSWQCSLGIIFLVGQRNKTGVIQDCSFHNKMEFLDLPFDVN